MRRGFRLGRKNKPYTKNIQSIEGSIGGEILTYDAPTQGILSLKDKYNPSKVISEGISYEVVTLLDFTNATVVGNGTDSITSVSKTSGGTGWNESGPYSEAGFQAPVTMEFYARKPTTIYAMIGWNTDPTTDRNYTTLDYAAYPYTSSAYRVYADGSNLGNVSGFDLANDKQYVVYDTDGFMRLYSGSELLNQYNHGTGDTVYLDTSIYTQYTPAFEEVRIIKASWDGSEYSV